MALARVKTINTTIPEAAEAGFVLLAALGSDNKPYALKVDESTGQLPTSATSATSGSGWTVQGDAVTVTAGATADVYSLRTGGVAGTIVQVITVNYTDVTKETIASIVRTTP